MITPGIIYWIFIPALVISAYLCLGISIVVGGVLGEWLKSDIALKSYGSISVTNLVVALLWPVVVGILTRVIMPVSTKKLFFGVCAVTAWFLLLAVLTAMLVNQLWNIRWALEVMPIAALITEVVGALWLLNKVPFLSPWDSRGKSMLVEAVVAISWLVAAKAILLALIPSVTIRL